MTKKAIIELLKQTSVATWAQGGLVSNEEVEAARRSLIASWYKSVEEYNKTTGQNLKVDLDDNKISAGGRFAFLPHFPKTGPVKVQSADYSICGVWCKITDIIAESFVETDKTYAFQTRAGNCILWAKQ